MARDYESLERCGVITYSDSVRNNLGGSDKKNVGSQRMWGQ
jgi:hypothetical protein